MRAALAAARQVAATDATVLLLGESGTGKSQLARYDPLPRAGAPRRRSWRSTAPRCPRRSSRASSSDTRRARSPARPQRKAGHLAAADGGTLFLDEIGEISAATQVKLLRFLQDRSSSRSASTEARRVDVRVVAATNRDLDAAVAAGAFREDLFYRLNVFAIRVPPLRERREDILPLAERFLAARGLPAAKLVAGGARAAPRACAGRGTCASSRTSLERALILAGDGRDRRRARGTGGARTAARAGARTCSWPGFDLDAFERELIHAALERAGGNKTAAARLLGITRRRLYSLLASHGGGRHGEPDDA